MTRRGWVGAGALLLSSGLVSCGGDPACPSEEPGVACVYIGTGQLALGPDGRLPRETPIYWAFDMEWAPDGTPYFIDWNNHMIRRIGADGRVETVIGGGFLGVGDGAPDGSDMTAPGAPGTDIDLNHPTDLQFDADGNLLLMAWHNHKVRRWDPTTRMVRVIAGSAPGFRGNGGPMASALFNQPRGLVRRASDGALFVLDQRNFMVRLIAGDGTVSTIAGRLDPMTMRPMSGYSGDGGAATDAALAFEAGPNPEPSGGIALSPDERFLYIADGLNFRIRRVDLSTGIIDTVIGTGESGFSGDGGPGRSAQISHTRDLEVGPDGRVYFCDTENDRIRAWDPATDVVETVAGTGVRGTGAEGVLATEIDLNRPMGIAFAPDGAMVIADTANSRYLRVVR